MDQLPHQASLLRTLTEKGPKKLIDRHLLAGFLYSNYSRFSSQEILAHLKNKWVSQEIMNNYLERESLNIASLLNQSNIKVMFLKGLHLIGEIYQFSGDRAMEDADLLVPSHHDLLMASKILINHGYEEVVEPKWWANDFKRIFLKTDNDVRIIIEIHCQILMKKKVFEPFNESQFMENGVYYLNKEELLTHLIGHLANQHNFIRLNWLVDI